LAVKDADDAPDGTATTLGTVTALLLLAIATLRPFDGAAELRDTVHVVVPAPVKELLSHVSALTDGAKGDAGPLRAIDVVFKTFPCVAVSVTVCEAVTAETFATKLALAVPEGKETKTGRLTAALLLARSTTMPPLGAEALNVTVQVSVPDPIIDELAQFSPVNEAVEETDPLP
jgi:hypothetical protein